MKKKIIIISSILISLILLFTLYCLLFTRKSSLFLVPPPRRSPPATSEESFRQSKNIIPLPEFTLDSIFNPDHSWTNQLPADQILTLITTGDIIPARSVNFKMTQYNDFTHPFLKTADFLKSADLTLINLESSLVKDCPVTNEGMVFCGNQRFVDGLKFAGIDIASLANNHTLNWNVDGLCQTINLLEQNQILASGFAGNLDCIDVSIHRNQPTQLVIKEIKEIKLGFVGWNFLDEYNEEEVLETIKQAKSKVDFLIISPHWGAEYQPYPSEQIINLAHKIIEAGADLIAGNHPHWIQPLEIYQSKLIIYAHGNFIFDQEWSEETKTGYVTKLTIYQGKIVDCQIFPVFISDFNQPEFLTGEKKQAVLDNLRSLSLSLAEK